jgi:2-succinyl-5-enolpyruvyl-6-hydroxy-3-cyclohexene-1-carboxylate synthase
MGTRADLQSEWARLVVHSLVRAGVRQAVISPGSRSTPFVIAALEEPELECISALDERAAAHFALGQARASGRPSLALCTSGSAPANYFPAVIEASEAGLPLVVLSADRPPELLHSGANQTTDQFELFGRHVRFFAQLGEPRADDHSLRAAKRVATRAVFEALGLHPGPVHLNAQARKPLEPTTVLEGDAVWHPRIEAISEEPLRAISAGARLDDAVVQAVTRLLDQARRPLVLCGPTQTWQAASLGALRTLVDRGALAVASEAAGQARFGEGADVVIGGFDTLWRTRTGREALCPDVVLQLGANPTSKGWEELCAFKPVRRVVVHPWAWVDPIANAELVVRAPLPDFVRALSEAPLDAGARDAGFTDELRRAESMVWEVARRLLDEAGDSLTEGGVARTVGDTAPGDSALVLGNSLPIRNFDTWVPPRERPLRIFSQRGVSGIDGVVSGAAGIASCDSSATTVLVGDVSFLHDLNGLQLAAQVPVPMVVVVVNNRGGRIFEQLPIAREGTPAWLPYFTTPHEASIEGAASIYGCAFESTRSVRELRAALGAAYSRGGCTVIEAVVPPQGSAAQNAKLWSEVEQALRHEGL